MKFQDEAADAFHIATIAGEFGRASNVNIHSFALGAKLSRNNIRTKLAGEGLECILNGLYLTRGEQLADHHMIVEHAQPHCASHEYFNGILDDKSKGVFHGRILRASRRAENRREADEQKSAALRRRDRRHQAATGNLRRRREMHARRDHRPVERRIHFLSALARHRHGHGAADVDSRLCRRNHRAREMRSRCARNWTSSSGTGWRRIRILPENDSTARRMAQRFQQIEKLHRFDSANLDIWISLGHSSSDFDMFDDSTTFISRSSLTTARSRAISTRCRRRPARRRATIRSAATS